MAQEGARSIRASSVTPSFPSVMARVTDHSTLEVASVPQSRYG